MVPNKQIDPLGILGDKAKKQADPLGILKKKEPSVSALETGGEAGTSEVPSGFAGLKPAKVQPIKIKGVGEEVGLGRPKREVAVSTAVKPVVGLDLAKEKAIERAAAPKLPKTEKEIGEVEAFFNSLERGLKQGQIADMMALGQMPSREDLKEIARLTREQQALPASDAYEKFNSASDLSTAAKEFIKNPFEISSQLIGESLSALVRHGATRGAAGAGIGAALGSVIPGFGTATGAGLGYLAGSGVAGYNLEMASSILDSFREAGVDISDEKSLQKGFDNPETLKKAREFANKRAIPIALFDMFSAGMGGKLLGKPAKTMLQKVGRGAAEVGVQAGLAGAGEATAQKVSGQKFNPTAIFAEMVGEVGGGAPDIVVGTMIEKKKQGQPITKEVATLDIKPEELQDMLDVSEATGELTDAQADEIKNEYAKVQEVRSVVPEQYKKNAEVIEALQKKKELEQQKKGLDPVFAKKIDAQIAEQEAKIDRVTTEEVTPKRKYRVEYFDPEKGEMTHSYFDTRLEGDTFWGTLTDAQKSKGVKAYFEETIEPSFGEEPQVPATPEKAPEVKAEVVGEEVAPQVPAAPKEEISGDIELSNLLKKYDEGDIVTFNDLVDEIEALENPAYQDAIDEYRAEQEEDYRLGGRGDMDAAEERFLQQVKEKSAPQKLAPAPIEFTQKEDAKIKDIATKANLNIGSYIKSVPTGKKNRFGNDINKYEATNPFTNEKVVFEKQGDATDYVVKEVSKATTKSGREEIFNSINKKVVGEEVAPQVPVTPEKEIPEEYEGYYKEGLPTYNIEDFKKNPKILESDEAYLTIGYPNSFIGLSTDRSLISKENNIPPESIKVGDIVSVSGKKYAVEDISELKKGKESVRLLRVNEKGDFIRQRDLPKKEAAELSAEEIEEEAPEAIEELPFGETQETGRVSGISPEALPAEAKAGDAARRLAERIRQGKISKLGGFRAGTGFDAVWDASLEVIAKALEGGASVADAIEQGLKYAKSTGWYKKLTNPADFDKKYREQLNEEYNAIQEPTAGEVPVQPEARVSEEVEGGIPPTEPPKPPQEGEAEGAAEKKSVELSLKGINDVANEFSIEQVEGRPRKTDIELREEAKAQIDKWVSEGSYEKNIDSLIKRAEESEVLTDKDRVILEQHLANLRQEFKDGIENGTITPNSPEFDNRLNGLKKLINAAAKTRSAAGAALRIPVGGSVAHPLENYDTALVAKMEANGVDVLTPEQKIEVEESVKLYKQKLDDANAKIKDLEEKMSQMMAEEEVGIAKKKRQIKSKEERIQERKDAIAAAKEALRRLRSGQEGLSAVALPYVREFVAIAPHVKKVMESYVGEGIDNLTVLIDKIYEDFKDVVPEITRKDVRDIIGGDYSPKKETLNQQKRIVNELKQEAKLLGEYEKLLAGEEPRLPRQKVQKNRKVKELRDKINEIRKRNREADVDYTDLKRINDTKNRALQRAEEYKKKIENKDFAPAEESVSIFNDLRLQKKFPKEYGEMLDAVKEKEDAKHEFDIALLKDEQQKETRLQKTGRFLKNIVGTTKAIKAGIDDSGVLIQNFAAVLAYPASGLKTFLNHWQDFASEKKFNRWHTQLKNNKPVWDLIQRSGLSITEPAALKEAQKEEIFSNNLLDRTFKVAGKSYNIGKYTTKPFERLFVSMGNGLRVDVFLRLAQKMYEEGKTFETHPEDFKSLAAMLNSMTGRGKLAPAVQRASDIIGGGIWSPQLMASRLNLLGISDIASPLAGRKGYYQGLTPEVRKMQIRNMAQMIGAGLSLMALASLAGGESDLEPESSTFGTIKIGTKRIPVWSNFSKYVKAIAQFATGKQKIEGERISKNRMQTVTKFFRSGVPPATGAVIDILTGRDYMGQPVTAEGLIRSAIAPMSLDAIAKEVKRDGALGAVTGLGQFFGLNISDERDYVKREDRPFKVKDPKTFKERETTPSETEKYIKIRDIIYDELVKEYKNETIYITQGGKVKLSRPSSVPDDEFDLWKEVTSKQLNQEQAKEYYKLLMSKAKREAKQELELEPVEEEKEE